MLIIHIYIWQNVSDIIQMFSIIEDLGLNIDLIPCLLTDPAKWF